MKFWTHFSWSKPRLSLLLVLLLGGNVWAQELSDSAIPARASQSMAALQPGIAVSWRSGPGPTYEAFFNKAGKSQVYVYDVNGALQLKKLAIAKGLLPANVRHSIEMGYRDQPVEAAYKVVSRTKQRFYEVQMPSSQGRDYLRYAVQGNLLGRTTMALQQPTPTALDPAQTVAQARETATPSTPVRPATTMRMRGESTSTVETDIDLSKDINLEDEMMDDDIKDLLDDSEDFDIESLNDADMDGFEDIDLIELDEEDDWELIDPFK